MAAWALRTDLGATPGCLRRALRARLEAEMPRPAAARGSSWPVGPPSRSTPRLTPARPLPLGLFGQGRRLLPRGLGLRKPVSPVRPELVLPAVPTKPCSRLQGAATPAPGPRPAAPPIPVPATAVPATAPVSVPAAAVPAASVSAALLQSLRIFHGYKLETCLSWFKVFKLLA